MKNTNEKNEMVTLDGDSIGVSGQIDGVVEKGQEQGFYTEDMIPVGEEADEAKEEEDATLRLIRQFPKVCERIAELMRRPAENAALELLNKGEHFDEAVANAENEGYLRGKNEKIELVKNHRMNRLDDVPERDDTEQDAMFFPRYSRHSVWE